MKKLHVAGAGLVFAGLALGVAGCVSDRAAGPGVGLDGCNVQLPAEAFGSTIVVIRDFNFSPSQVTVAPGGKVTWVSCEPQGSESHTSTADAGAWSSPLLPPGSTFTRQFEAPGTFPYHCEPHPGMLAMVTVQ